MVTQTPSPIVFVCACVCETASKYVVWIWQTSYCSHLLFVCTPAVCLPECASECVCVCAHAHSQFVFFTRVQVCGCVSPRVGTIMIVHTHEYICGFKSHCLPRRVQTAALMRHASAAGTAALRARPRIIDLLYRTPGRLDNYLIPRIKITRQINLRWGDEVKINSVLVQGKAEVEHEFELGAASLSGGI